ncbi:MAG TPA: ADP-glyceromanno-heptose 6-epimerase [Bacteroidales bacterium]|nr:ADP-glyceromanno-heptose 6-epimerase [Bacteroidales bacterium]HOS20301.1 ADP-glyceromanno-heptose 6-epimerase [Bacteroidales bacterium]HPL02279.1 ADP-glyceromanno-heptose 6-epimerase [Bacteroidales bacterium]HPX46006.1 ADP-glyceromanno-heptose 6-epimerase [Bacteroidales bacterium]HQC60373.1 ADP-glyceromanno-heptose 6-epimerase [Bacteroidales bacterium]
MSKFIVVTGAAGFIGSVLANYLNINNLDNIIIVDDFTKIEKLPNYNTLPYDRIERDQFIDWLDKHHNDIDTVIHLGARTDTTEFDYSVFEKLNLNYSKNIWNICSNYGIDLYYASSAATYGDGALGYNDDLEIIDKLQPLNPYGLSKNEFDKWAIKQINKPKHWAGFKFFNVYGPNEYHKKRMASVVFHGYNQIKDEGKIKLFKSHRPDYKDGEQKRDFVYVKDVIKVLFWFLEHRPENSIYNLGTGTARSFIDLAKSIFSAMNINENIEFIDMPKDIRDKYQYFTEANMTKLHNIGYNYSFYSLENGISDYVKNYLMPYKYFNK